MSKYDLQLILGLDIYIQELELVIHHPTLEELGLTMMSTADFYQVIGILAIDGLKEEEINSFQSFMLVYNNLKDKTIKHNFNLLLDLLFPNCKVSFIPGRSMYIEQSFGEIKKSVLIDEGNFNLLQEAIKEMFCIADSNGEIEYNTKSDLGNKIKAKLMEGRKKVAELKAKNAVSHQDGDTFVKYISVISVGTGISLGEIKKYTLYQLYDILNRHHLWFNYDLDLRIRLAGGEVKNAAEDWTKNIH